MIAARDCELIVKISNPHLILAHYAGISLARTTFYVSLILH